MLWLAITWLALIALWGSSDRWTVVEAARRRLGHLHGAVSEDASGDPTPVVRR